MTQVQPKRKKLKWLIGILILIGLGAVFGIRHQRKTSTDVVYKEVPVERSNIEVKVLATGTVQPENRLEIKPPIAGRIEQVLVNEGKKVKKGQLLAWMSSTERAALLDAARAQGAEEVKKWEELYKPTPVIAPISGDVILRNVESGQTFTTSDALFVLSDRLTVKAQVDETDIAQIKLKQSAWMELDAYPGKSIEAMVDQIAFDAKTVNNVTTYVVDVLPKDTPPYMRSGMTANVTFLVDARKDVLVLPSDAIRMVGGKAIVLVSTSGTPVEQEVEVGLSDGKKTEIKSQLHEGDIVLAAQMHFEKKSANSNPFNPMGNRTRSGGR